MKDKFIFGVATSAYQIEGGVDKGGRTPSIWDAFCEDKKRIADGSDGKIACDHYHLFEEDIRLIKELGVDYYRLSISWSRIIPYKNKINELGIEFYRHLLRRLHEEGIKTAVTMYHWDLPLWIYEENKGWVSRDTVSYFLEYAKVLFNELDPYVDMWITLNEPWCSSTLGYLYGEHAPGHKNYNDYIKVHHHLMLAHGKTVQLYRDMNLKKPIGISINTTHTYVEKESYENLIAKNNDDGLRNRIFYEPLFKGGYPMDIINLLAPYITDWSFINPADFEIIKTPIDFLGINYYTWDYVCYDKNNPFYHRPDYKDLKKTTMGWDVTPFALKDLIIRLRNDYTDIPVYITENGSSWDDCLVNGEVNDLDRIKYLDSHLEVIDGLNRENMNIMGYFAWSLIDNFEWAHGYTKRFGLVYVDYQTLKRIPKKSYYHYQEIIRKRR